MNKILPFIIVLLILGGGIFLVKKTSLLKTRVTNQTGSTIPEAYPTQGSTASGVVAPPQQIPLSISSPADNQTVTTPNITVSGKTVPNADVSINDKDVKADVTGNFLSSIVLDEGENIISVSAYDADGNYSDQDISINYQTSESVQ